MPHIADDIRVSFCARALPAIAYAAYVGLVAGSHATSSCSLFLLAPLNLDPLPNCCSWQGACWRLRQIDASARALAAASTGAPAGADHVSATQDAGMRATWTRQSKGIGKGGNPVAAGSQGPGAGAAFGSVVITVDGRARPVSASGSRAAMINALLTFVWGIDIAARTAGSPMLIATLAVAYMCSSLN